MENKTLPMKSILVAHPNRDKIDEAQLTELAATLKERGLLSPILCTPHPTKKATYNLVAGERRFRAAQKLGWKEIDARLVADDDAGLQEIRLVENLQRVDLTPWEEAQQLRQLCEFGGKIEDIAARLGRTPQWVAVRLAYGKLIPELCQLVKEQAWPLGHLPLLARVPADAQPALLAALRLNQGDGDEPCDYDWFDEEGMGKDYRRVPRVPTGRELEEFLDGRSRLLNLASWKLADAELVPAAGACDACPKRATAQALLFPELAEGMEDRCLDEACWGTKQAAFVQLSIARAREKGTEPVLLAGSGRGEVPAALAERIDVAKVERAWDYQECKKSDEGARPAVVVSGENVGEVKYVKPHAHAVNGNGHAQKERPVDPATGEKAEPTVKERQLALRLKRLCRAAELWSEKLPTLKVKFTGCVDALLIHFGTHIRHGVRAKQDWEAWATRKPKLNDDGWAELYPVFQDRLRRCGSLDHDAVDVWREAHSQAQALGLMSILGFLWKDAIVDVPLTKVLAELKVKDDVDMPGAEA